MPITWHQDHISSQCRTECTCTEYVLVMARNYSKAGRRYSIWNYAQEWKRTMIQSTKPWMCLRSTCSHFLFWCSGQPSRISCSSCCKLTIRTRQSTRSCSTPLRQHTRPITWHQDQISSQCRSDEYIQNMSWLISIKRKERLRRPMEFMFKSVNCQLPSSTC